MRRLIALFTMCWFINSPIVWAEEDLFKNAPNSLIEGINIYKLGSYKFSDLEAQIDLSKDASEIFKGKSYCDRSKVFKLKNRLISGIKVKELELSFYDDSLYKIEVAPGLKMSEALELKYGQPLTVREQKKIVCRHTLSGIESERTEETTYKRWKNGLIQVQGIYSSYFDSKCKPQFISLVEIYDSAISEEVRICAKSKYEKTEEEKRKKRLESLKNL